MSVRFLAGPRVAGTHGACLRLARETNILLMQVLAASSYNAAKYLGDTGLEAMEARGKARRGSRPARSPTRGATLTQAIILIASAVPSTAPASCPVPNRAMTCAANRWR